MAPAGGGRRRRGRSASSLGDRAGAARSGLGTHHAAARRPRAARRSRRRPYSPPGARASPEHRLRPHRRPLDGPAALHAAGRSSSRHDGHDVQELLRLGLAVLPVALIDLHRRVPPRHRGLHQRRGDEAASPPSITTTTRTGLQRRAPGRAGYRTAMMGKYINGYLGPEPLAHRLDRRPAGVVGVGRGRLGLPRVQLRPQHRRHRPSLRARPARLPHRRDRPPGRATSSTARRPWAGRSSSSSRPSRPTRRTFPRRVTRDLFPGLDGARARPTSTPCPPTRRPGWPAIPR